MAEPYRSKGARKFYAKLGSVLPDSFQRLDYKVLSVTAI